MFGAKRAYDRWCGMMDDGIAEARALLDKDPTNPRGLALLRAVDHSMACSSAFLFGRGTSLGGSDSVQEKRPKNVARIRQFRSTVARIRRNVAEMWQV